MIHFSAMFTAMITAVYGLLRERVAHLRDGLQMMGLTDGAFYLSAYIFFMLWTIPIVLLGCYTLCMPIGLGETLYPNTNVLLLAAYCWLFFQCYFSLCNTLGTVSNRKPVAIM